MCCREMVMMEKIIAVDSPFDDLTPATCASVRILIMPPSLSQLVVRTIICRVGEIPVVSLLSFIFVRST
jgi:hypothetical protein